jgi:hypothetical protein
VRSAVASAVVLALLSCAACSLPYRNRLHPAYGETEFDRDLYECRGGKGPPGSAPIGRFSRAATQAAETAAWSCMRERGWVAAGGE